MRRDDSRSSHSAARSRKLGAHFEKLEDRWLLSIEPIPAPFASIQSQANISADGRFIVFDSEAQLTPQDVDNDSDVYLRDQQTGVISLISDASVRPGDFNFLPSAITQNGRFVLFGSYTGNGAGTAQGPPELFLRDLQTGTTTLAMVGVYTGGISEDGQFVTYEQTNPLNNNRSEALVRNIHTGAITIASVGLAGPSNGNSKNPSISGDGRYVVFESTASNLAGRNPGNHSLIYLRDLQAGVTVQVGDLTQIDFRNATGDSFNPRITPDGRYVVFENQQYRSVAGFPKLVSDVYVADRQSGTIAPVTRSASGGQSDGNSSNAVISDDGRFVSFESYSGNLIDGVRTGEQSVYLRDLQKGTIRLMNFGPNGQSDSGANSPSVTESGNVLFASSATNLLAPPPAQSISTFLWSDDHDATPPTVSASFEARESVTFKSTSLTLNFSEAVLGQNSTTNYELRYWGTDATFGTADDVIKPIINITSDGLQTTLSFAPLGTGVYRLTIKDAIADANANRLDGDRNGSAGGNFVGTFTVVQPNYLDPTFGAAGKTIVPSIFEFSAVSILADGKILAAGRSAEYTTGDVLNPNFALARFNSDGTLDSSFGVGGVVIAPVSPGADAGRSLVVQSDGRILVGGYIKNATDADFAVARYDADGALDPNFGVGGVVTTQLGGGQDYAWDMRLQSDGRIVLAGETTIAGVRHFALARYLASGAIDQSFGSGGQVVTQLGQYGDAANALIIQADGKLVAGGATVFNGAGFTLVRYNVDGSLDPTFGAGGIVMTQVTGDRDAIYALAVQPDGKLVAAGSAGLGETLSAFALTRYNPDGSRDASFGDGGKLITHVAIDSTDVALDVALDAAGRIIVAGYSRNDFGSTVTLVRYDQKGSLDQSFGVDGILYNPITGFDFAESLALQSDGLMVVAGAVSQQGFVARLSSITPASTITAAHLFYNNSAFDGSAGATPSDDDAIASDKVALRPDHAATFANYTSYSRGLNGLMFDLVGRPDEPLSAEDFRFRVGNDSDPSHWADAPTPESISIRQLADAGGTDRVTIVWPDNAIENEWLEVTVLATPRTGIVVPQTYYFGNQIGESGDSATSVAVDGGDELAARDHFSPAVPGVDTSNALDFNRDRQVNAADEIMVRNHAAPSSAALQLIAPPFALVSASPPPLSLIASAPPTDGSAADEITAEIGHIAVAVGLVSRVAGAAPANDSQSAPAYDSFVTGQTIDSAEPPELPQSGIVAAMPHSLSPDPFESANDDLFELIANEACSASIADRRNG